MNIFNVVFKHVTKNLEISIGINIKKIKLTNKDSSSTLRIDEMKVFNIVFKRTTKNYELCIGISIRKLSITNKALTTKLEIVQK